MSNGSCLLGYRNSNKSTRLIETAYHIKPVEPCPKPMQVKELTAELCFQVLYKARRVTSTEGAMAKEKPIHISTVWVKHHKITIDEDESEYIEGLIKQDAERVPSKNGILYNRLIDLASRFHPFGARNQSNNVVLNRQGGQVD